MRGVSLHRRRILLARRPQGQPVTQDFEWVEEAVPALSEGQLLVRNIYLSIDPAIRGWMAEGASYIAPIALGEVIRSGSIAEVVASEHPEWRPGQILIGLTGWEDYSVLGPQVVGRSLQADLPLALASNLGVLGGCGLAAYFGLLEVGKPQAGETVVVSAAAGGVGSIAGQIARVKGCRVVGIAGSDAKCAWIVEQCGFDAAINYKREDVSAALRQHCPKGVDIYFDNVGGAILDAVLARIRVRARVVLCGAIAQINAETLPPGPRHYIHLLARRARMEGFVTLDYADQWAAASAQLAQWVLEGAIHHREHIVEGLERAPEALGYLFDGSHWGKLIVQVGPEPAV